MTLSASDRSIRDDFRVLDETRRAVDYPRDKDDVVSWRVLPECRVFMLMARVGEFNAERTDVCAIEQRQ
jgi:hypothetical protein